MERNERRGWILLEKRSEATMAGAGFKVGSSPRSKSRFSRQTFSTGQRFALFRFLSFFLSFFSVSFFIESLKFRLLTILIRVFSLLRRFSRRILLYCEVTICEIVVV